MLVICDFVLHHTASVTFIQNKVIEMYCNFVSEVI